MKRASRYFADYDKNRIEQAVKDAETKTAAEIVPVLATESGRYDRAEDIVGLWTGVAAFAVAWLLLSFLGADETHWGTTWTRFEFPIYLAAIVLGFVVGALVSTYSGAFRGLFTPSNQMREEVNATASRIFYDQRIHHTRAATGLLIYVSLFEHMATIIADQRVMDALGQQALDEMCEKLVAGIKTGDAATAYCETIADAANRLKDALPRTDTPGADRLPNALIVID